jgi:hypothetical protein
MDNKKWLIHEFKKRLGDDINVEIICMKNLRKEKNGKFKSVESHFKPSLR